MRFTATLILSLFVVSLFSAPALRMKKKLTLEDGSKIEVTFIGDENAHYYVTADGYLVEQSENGAYYIKTERKLSDVTTTFVKSSYMMRLGAQSSAPLKSIGSPKIPVVLVEFSDRKFEVAATSPEVNKYYDLYCNGLHNGTNYTGAGSDGSIRDYFIAQSDSLFKPEFTIIGPVTLSKAMAYYGANSGTRTDVNFATFRAEAIAEAMKIPNVNWSDFDNDGNSTVDMVYFIYAGLGENVGGGSDALWPKESTSSLTINGKVFSTSACCNELRPATYDEDGNILTTKADGIGVMCHELSHALGLPDFYDTQGLEFGMDMWSLMDYGNYCKNGYAPIGYTGYERDFMGWRKLQTLEEPSTIQMTALEADGFAYKVVNDANLNEYYILENRNEFGWDKTLSRSCGHGMVAIHVDYNASAWSSNKVNIDPNHQRMTIIAANNLWLNASHAQSASEYFEVLAGNPYPGITGNRELSNTSVPAAKVFTGGYMNKPIYNIVEQDGVITFKFRPRGTLSAPDMSTIGDVESSMFRFTASWPMVEEADNYTLELYSVENENDYSFLFSLDSLSTTSQLISGLEPGKMYAYRVRAMADDYLDSPFSEYKEVRMKVDGIEDAMLDADDDVVNVFSNQGIWLGTYHQKSLHSVLNKGLYIIRYNKGHSAKIIIK